MSKKDSLPIAGRPATVRQLANWGMGHPIALYAAIKRGDLKAIRVGKKLLIPASEWMRFGGESEEPPKTNVA